ncbi:hypothetical protein DM860_018116 [Cuscuta australis]|uniref:Transmembrane protein n=1 Tax=Cuscuta australis TaxID=267555 RepID=A0A328DYR5_9ASTE|nr:hypothetical protein DM860_018116 [Cuscuta australis]
MSQQFQPEVNPLNNNNVPVLSNNNFPSSTDQLKPSSSSSSSHSNGSFGLTFLILGAILVVSVLACVVNRMCSTKRRSINDNNINHRRHEDDDNNSHVRRDRGVKVPKSDHQGKNRDLELGKIKSTSHSSKVAPNSSS